MVSVWISQTNYLKKNLMLFKIIETTISRVIEIWNSESWWRDGSVLHNLKMIIKLVSKMVYRDGRMKTEVILLTKNVVMIIQIKWLIIIQ